MASFISSFRAPLIAIGVIAAIEASVWFFATPAPLAASNFWEQAYLKPENNSKVMLLFRMQATVKLDPDIVQVGDSSGLHGAVPQVIESYLAGLSYINAGFGADVGYLGHYNHAKILLDHLSHPKALVLYVTPMAKPAHYGDAGRTLERSLYSSFLSPWRYIVEPPSLAFRSLVTNLLYYGKPDKGLTRQSALLGDRDGDGAEKFFANFPSVKGFVPREAAFPTRDPLPLGGCRFADWFEPSAEGEIPFDFFYPGLAKMAQLAREKNVRFVVIFNPVPCHRSEEEGTLRIERELARFRADYPEAVVPFPLITTWPEELYVDSWHLFSFGAERMSHRIGPELHRMLEDPTYRGVPPRSVDELDRELEGARNFIARPKTCEDNHRSEEVAPASDDGTYTNCIGMRFATVPAGEFIMGSCRAESDCPVGGVADPDARDNEMPARKLKMERAFQISQTPVSVAQFYTFIHNDEAIGADPRVAHLEQDSLFLSTTRVDQADPGRPITFVRWFEAQAFVKWLNRVKPSSDRGTYRLPTEAEREYAARGGSRTAYWWGDRAGWDMANCNGCTDQWNGRTAPLASFAPNRFGLFDMNGNVWEWVQDCYRDWYNETIHDARAFERPNCEMRTIRGGSADYPAASARSAARFFNGPSSRSSNIGFRVVREPRRDEVPTIVDITPTRRGAIPISSGGSPERAFDDDKSTFWVSPERGLEIARNAWIGLQFDLPRVVRRIEVEQPDSPLYRQSHVLVQYSRDGGINWVTAARSQLLAETVAVLSVPKSEPAMRWRLLADGNNTAEERLAWTPTEIRFFAAEPVKFEAAPPEGGAAIASGEDDGSPERAFDHDLASFWVSRERGSAVKGSAWIGYRFADPQAIRGIRIEQPINPSYRQDFARVEKSLDGGTTWVAAAPGPYRLNGTAGWIDLPEGEPARLWRIVAAGDNATSPDHAWTVQEVGFLVDESNKVPPYVAADMSEGMPLASGEGAGAPERAFDHDLASFWVSHERGQDVKGTAWIGYRFTDRQAIRGIRVEQPINPGYRQDLVRVEKSLDGGMSWVAAAPGPYRLSGTAGWIDLPEGEPARLWRIVAAADNSAQSDHAWTVQGIDFFVRDRAYRARQSFSPGG